jgi:hypothetical protein
MEKQVNARPASDSTSPDQPDQADGNGEPSLGSAADPWGVVEIGQAPRISRQRWKTFLKNHSSQIVSIDFLVVPTITFKLLHALVFLSHDRRRIIHFNVTAHPTAHWSAQLLRNAFSDEEPPRFLMRDLDT